MAGLIGGSIGFGLPIILRLECRSEITYKWIFSIIGSNIIFNIIEYFSFINLI